MTDKDLILRSCDGEDISNLFFRRQERMNKGDAGRVLCICGSYNGSSGMCGAAYFAAMAAYRCGAGIVEIFTARENYAALGALVPEAVFSLYGECESSEFIGARLRESIKKADCVIIGCGLGKSNRSRALLKAALETVSVPMVIDADALNMMAENGDLWSLMSEQQRGRTVITPHPGEMSRLCKKSVAEILESTTETAEEFSRERGVVCLLKDHRTVITNGAVTYINHSGNAGMATAGSGDVLAGIIGALLARDDVSGHADLQKTGDDAVLYRASVGAYIHGLAGDAAAACRGEYSMIATDILHEIAGVIMQNES